MKSLFRLFLLLAMSFSAASLALAQENTYTASKIITNGFGNSNNTAVARMCSFSGSLYAGTENESQGSQIWKSTDGGTNWTIVEATRNGFGDPNNTEIMAMTEWNGALYVSTRNEATGTELWATTNGTSWSQVNANGFGSRSNEKAREIIPYQDRLFVLTGNYNGGGQVWASSNGTSWTQVNTSGFGNYRNTDVAAGCVFNGYLFCATENEISSAGIEIWCYDGSSWTKTASSGFGDANNIFPTCMTAFNGYIYVGTENNNTIGETWRSADGSTWEQVGQITGTTHPPLFAPAVVENDRIYAWGSRSRSENLDAAYYSSDGVTWSPVVLAANGTHFSGFPFYSVVGKIYAVVPDSVDFNDVWQLMPTQTGETVAAPSSLAVPASDNDGSYTVSWGASSTASVSYVLEEATDSGFTSGLRTAYSGTETSVLITERSDAAIYYYRVKAIRDGYADSDWITGLNTCTVDQTHSAAGMGDVDGDGNVGIADAILALKILGGLPVAPNLSADVNGDGRVGATEAAFALQAAAERRVVITTSRDAQGVWFISGPESASLFDVFEAMGYAVATDRLWQAETFRRSGRGTLAEILGQSSLSQDILVRTTGYSDAELTAGFNALDSETQAMVSGYVAGFNRRIAEIFDNPALLPFEFAALSQSLGVTADAILKPWTVEDVLAWTSVMLRNFDPEAQRRGQLDNAELLQVLSALYPSQFFPMFNDLRWTDDPDALTYIAPGAQGAALRAPMGAMSLPPDSVAAMPPVSPALKRLDTLYKEAEESLEKIGAKIQMGSYAWAVAGDKTATGNPMIYSGPQMGFMTPSIILEGSIRAGGLNISGMAIAGLPGIVIGRIPHHAWSMQVGHAHTLDYYFEAPEAVSLDRMETFKVAGQADVTIPVWKSVHGPIINPLPFDPNHYNSAVQGPIVAYKYSHAGREFATLKAYLDLARAESMDAFGAAMENVAVSQHFCYADRDGNIAYWMSGYDPNRSAADYRFPQGAVPGLAVGEWQEGRLPLATVRNPAQGYVGGWNNRASTDYPGSVNNLSYSFGPFHRAHVIDEYLSTRANVTFEEVRDLALNIATTDSFGAGGNPWPFVEGRFTAAVNAVNDDLSTQRQAALDSLSAWDGHFVSGGQSQWVAGTDRPDAWVLMDAWIREVIRLTFQDELRYELSAGKSLFEKQPTNVLFNVLLHGLNPDSVVKTNYNWFANASDAGAPQTAEAIIVAALDSVLADLGDVPWGTGQRGTIPYNHDVLGQLGMNPVHTMPFSSRSTYAHVVEMGAEGPVRIASMFPLGASGDIRIGEGGSPVLDSHFFSMTPFYDNFDHRAFPLP